MPLPNHLIIKRDSKQALFPLFPVQSATEAKKRRQNASHCENFWQNTKLLHTESAERMESLPTAKEKIASEIKVTFPKDVALLRCLK